MKSKVKQLKNTIHLPPNTYSLWHSRLGHPSSLALQSPHSNKFISYKPLNSRTVCASYLFGKHVMLSFVSSNIATMMPFDILHSDL